MDGSAHVDSIRLESERFSRAAREPLDTPVPSCPDWSLADLVWHLGGVQRFWAEIVRTRATDRGAVVPPDDMPDAELPGWFDVVSAALVDALASAEAGTRVWSWADGQQDVTWVMRRQAHEVAVHRWDAQRSIGRPDPIAPELAADGIDEFFQWMVGPEDAEGFDGSVAVRLEPTDADPTWVVSVADGRSELGGDAASADVTARGTSSDLLLMLWRRLGSNDMTAEGDSTALERVIAVADLT